MGVWGFHGESSSVTGFDETTSLGTEMWCPAVVVRRFPPAPREPLLRWLWLFVRDLLASQPPPPPRPVTRLPDGWNSASDFHGPREVLFSTSRRLVRVGGGEQALPEDGFTLVLLVDEREGGATTTTRHSMRLAAVPRSALTATADAPAWTRDLHRLRRESMKRWYASVTSDPVVAAFLEERD